MKQEESFYSSVNVSKESLSLRAERRNLVFKSKTKDSRLRCAVLARQAVWIPAIINKYLKNRAG